MKKKKPYLLALILNSGECAKRREISGNFQKFPPNWKFMEISNGNFREKLEIYKGKFPLRKSRQTLSPKVKYLKEHLKHPFLLK